MNALIPAKHITTFKKQAGAQAPASKGKGKRMKKLEVLEYARQGMRHAINGKKRLYNQLRKNHIACYPVLEELEALKAKYSELERLIIAEKERGI